MQLLIRDCPQVLAVFQDSADNTQQFPAARSVPGSTSGNVPDSEIRLVEPVRLSVFRSVY